MPSFKFVPAFLAILAIATVPVTAMAHGKGDKKHINETHDVSGFDKLEIGGVYDLDVTVGEKFSVRTSGHENEVTAMTIKVEGDTLVVGRKKKAFRNFKRNQNGIEINITMPALSEVAIGGVADGKISGIDADHLQVQIGGVGGIEFSGKCKTLDIEVGGVGELDARDLKCESAEVQLAGVGEIDLYASHSVDVQTAGVGEVNVYGNPDHVAKSKSFLSEVNIK
ncbi:MAG: DUF2807 domain-containing protein [Acidimicrobiales bacterium]|nr:DUF2807 domain-containing protein [Hyphomonadaceae bacterium]RZV42140.1 MAG: DUF2807 domain-containing protein [Acidimicrobiales bacterium]